MTSYRRVFQSYTNSNETNDISKDTSLEQTLSKKTRS